MKKSLMNSTHKIHKTSAGIIFYTSCAILSIMFLSGIVTMLLPRSIITPYAAAEIAENLLGSASRVIALSAIFFTLASILEIKYPKEE